MRNKETNSSYCHTYSVSNKAISRPGKIFQHKEVDLFQNISDVMDEYLLIEYGRLDSNKDAVYREEYVNPSGWLRPEKLSKEIKLRYR